MSDIPAVRIPKTTATRYPHPAIVIRGDRFKASFKEKIMTLAARLDTIRQGADKRIPPDKRAIMHRATDDLRASGIMDRVIKIGDPLPPFALQNAFGEEVRSSELLANGPLVLTVFRGSW
jgi:hypothetical protein